MKRLKPLWLRNQLKPLVAWRAMRELLKTPDDTTQVFHIIEALKGNSLGAAVRRLRSSDRGRALLQIAVYLVRGHDRVSSGQRDVRRALQMVRVEPMPTPPELAAEGGLYRRLPLEQIVQ